MKKVYKIVGKPAVWFGNGSNDKNTGDQAGHDRIEDDKIFNGKHSGPENTE